MLVIAKVMKKFCCGHSLLYTLMMAIAKWLKLLYKRIFMTSEKYNIFERRHVIIYFVNEDKLALSNSSECNSI